MQKVKIFETKQEEKINEFLGKVTGQNITVRNGKVIIIYEDPGVGMTKADLLAVISSEIAKIQQKVISDELDERYWRSQEVLARGGTDKQQKVRENAARATQQLETTKTQLRQFKELYSEIEKNEYKEY